MHLPTHLYNWNISTCRYCLVVLLQPVLHYFSFLWQAFTIRIVTKATPIQFIDGRSLIKKWRGRKTALSGYCAYLSCDLLLMPLGADTHTHTQTFTHKMILRNQASTNLQPAHTWFNNIAYANYLINSLWNYRMELL